MMIVSEIRQDFQGRCSKLNIMELVETLQRRNLPKIWRLLLQSRVGVFTVTQEIRATHRSQVVVVPMDDSLWIRILEVGDVLNFCDVRGKIRLLNITEKFPTSSATRHAIVWNSANVSCDLPSSPSCFSTPETKYNTTSSDVSRLKVLALQSDTLVNVSTSPGRNEDMFIESSLKNCRRDTCLICFDMLWKVEG